jgi:hypothetical protein
MDNGTMKDYIEDLIQQVNTLEAHFRALEKVMKQLQDQRDLYLDLWLKAEAKLANPAGDNG